jgi:DNA (cytosine-5)-methyltransferase 1
MESTQQKEGSMHGVGLSDYVRMWPTPTSRDWKGAYSEKSQKKKFRNLLPDAVKRSWPTPRASDAENASKSRRDSNAQLREAVQRPHLWPTPQASDNRDRGNMSSGAIKRRVGKGKQIMLSQSVSHTSGALNPMWVEWLMGYPLGHTDLKPSETQ